MRYYNMNKCSRCRKKTHNEEMFGIIWCDECDDKWYGKMEKNIKTHQIKSGEF